jgi:hypothetical protein
MADKFRLFICYAMQLRQRLYGELPNSAILHSALEQGTAKTRSYTFETQCATVCHLFC